MFLNVLAIASHGVGEGGGYCKQLVQCKSILAASSMVANFCAVMDTLVDQGEGSRLIFYAE